MLSLDQGGSYSHASHISARSENQILSRCDSRLLSRIIIAMPKPSVVTEHNASIRQGASVNPMNNLQIEVTRSSFLLSTASLGELVHQLSSELIPSSRNVTVFNTSAFIDNIVDVDVYTAVIEQSRVACRLLLL